MAKEKVDSQDKNLQTIEETLSKTEHYIEENQKTLLIIVAAIVVLVGGYFGYQRFYKAPLEKEAQSQMFMAERYFERDSFKLALNGDGNYSGFLKIINEYGSTKSGNLAYYYAGISYLRSGDFDNAIKYLGDFDSDDHLVAPIALGGIGDAYREKNNSKEAVEFYVKAYKKDENNFTAPIYMMKAGETYEELNLKDKALEVYQELKDRFPKTNEGRKAEKSLVRLQMK